MTAIRILALNTFRGLMRRQTLFNVVILGVGLVLLALVVSNISYGFPDRIVRSLGLSGISISLNLLGLLLGASLVAEEVEQRTLYVVLTRPVGRGIYVVGRFAGAAVVLALVALGFYGVLTGVLLLIGVEPSGLDVVAAGFMWLEALVLLAFALVLSCFSTPLLSVGIGLGFWVICASIDDVRALMQRSEDPFVSQLVEVVYWLVPSFHLLNYREVAVYQDPVVLTQLLAHGAYGLACAAMLVVAGVLVLQRRQFF